MSVLLHFGLFKTGTQSLQLFLREHERVLADGGACFPRGWLRLNCHLELPLIHMRLDRMSSARIKGTEWLDAAWRADVEAQVRRYLAEHADQRVILSSAHFSLLRHDDELSRVRDVVGDAEVVVYLREPSEWLASLRDEWTKYGLPLSDDPEEWNCVGPASWLLDYEGRLATWRSFFPRLVVFDYDACVRADGSVIPSFCRHLGLPIPPDVAGYWLNARGTVGEGKTPGVRWSGGQFGA